MISLAIDLLGIVSSAKDILATGNQKRVKWLKDRRILNKIQGFVSTNEKLSHTEKRQILKLIQADKKLRQCVLHPKRIGDLQRHLLQSSVDEPALGRIAEPLCRLVETLAIEEYASTGEELIYEKVFEQTVAQDETLTLVREQHVMLQEQRERDRNPLKSMEDIAHDKFRGYGIQTININPDTRQSSFTFSKPFELTLRGKGQTAKRLRQFKENVLAGEIASLEFTPKDDLHVSVSPSIMEKVLSLNFSKIEARPTPQIVEQVIRYTVGGFSKAINTQIINDRAAKLFTFKLKTQQPKLKFEMSWDNEGRRSNFNVSLSLKDGQRPNISDLSVLHLISQLSSKENSLDIVDESSENTLASMDLSSSHPREELIHLSYLAYLTALYLEANNELQKAQIIDVDLPWPNDDDWNDSEMKLVGLFERIRDVLKDGNSQSSISGRATLVKIFEDTPDTIIEDGFLKGNMTINEAVFFGEPFKFTQNFTFDNPRIKLWQDGKELKAKSIREAFEKYGGPITLELQDDKATITFSKEDKGNVLEDQPRAHL